MVSIRQQDEARVTAAEVCKTQCSSTCMQLPSHSQSRALIYNLTWMEFILLRVDDQGRAGWRERGGRAFQPHFWYRAWLCHSLWSPSLPLFLSSAVLSVLSPSHTQTKWLSLLFSPTYCTMWTLTNRWESSKRLGKKREKQTNTPGRRV